MDEEIRQAIRNVQADPTDIEAVIALILLYIRYGLVDQLEAELARLGISRAVLQQAWARIPGGEELLRIINGIRRLTKDLKSAIDRGQSRRIQDCLSRLSALLARLEQYLLQNPHLRPAAGRAIRLAQQVIGMLRDTINFTKTLPASAASAAGPILIGASEVLLLFAAGILLPASKMGELSIELSAEKAGLDAFETLLTAYQQHIRQRDDYRHVPNWTKLRELMNSASALSTDIRRFLRQYPDDARKSVVEAMQRQVLQWIEDYYYGIGPSQPAPEPMEPLPPAAPPGVPLAPAPAQPVPPTIAAPPTLEWQEGEHIRKLIQIHKEWIRKWKKKKKEALPYEEKYKEELDKAIKREMDELEKLREKAQAIGQSTGEDYDEPLDDPPPPPMDMMTVTFIEPVHEYVNRKTGEKRTFTDANPPDPEEWAKVEFDFTTGQWNIRWGWVQQYDPDTGKPSWAPGWVLIN